MNAPKAPRRGLSWKVVGSVFVGLVLAGLGFAAFVYFTMIRYVPTAALHLPPDSSAAVNVDLEKVVLYEPFRKHLLPLVNELRANPSAGPRMRRIQEKTKIDLALDLREIAVARGASSDQWSVAIGGKFPKRGVLPGLRDVLVADGIAAELSPDARTLRLPGGEAIGQADDGVIVVASSSDRLGAALPPTDTHARLGLTPKSAVTFSFDGAPLAPLASHPAAFAMPALRDLGRIERATGTIALGTPLSGQARVKLEPGVDPQGASERVQGLITGLGLLVRLLGTDFAGEARVLSSARVEPAEDGAVGVRFEWRREDVDRAARTVADLIRAAARSGPAPR